MSLSLDLFDVEKSWSRVQKIAIHPIVTFDQAQTENLWNDSDIESSPRTVTPQCSHQSSYSSASLPPVAEDAFSFDSPLSTTFSSMSSIEWKRHVDHEREESGFYTNQSGMSLLLPDSVADGERDEIDQISEAIDETLNRIRCKLDNMLFDVRANQPIQPERIDAINDILHHLHALGASNTPSSVSSNRSHSSMADKSTQVCPTRQSVAVSCCLDDNELYRSSLRQSLPPGHRHFKSNSSDMHSLHSKTPSISGSTTSIRSSTKHSVKQAFKDIKRDVKEIKKDIKQDVKQLKRSSSKRYNMATATISEKTATIADKIPLPSSPGQIKKTIKKDSKKIMTGLKKIYKSK